MISKLRWFGIFALAFVLVFGLAGQALAAGKPEPAGLQRVIVVFEDGVPEASQNAIIKSFGGKSIKSLDLINGSVALIPPLSAEGLEHCQAVWLVEPDSIAEAAEQTNPWGVDRIDVELVHPINRGNGVKVALLDTGVDYTHADLDANFNPNLLGYDFVNGDSDPMDDNGHGTHVAGTIAAEDNGVGVVGVAPEASLYSLKVLNNGGGGFYSDIIAALEWCVDNGIHVANMSLGGTIRSSSLKKACDNACNAGVLLVAAAGNSGSSSILYPAKYDSVIAVSATDSSDNLAYFSNYGDEIELAGPGVSINSTLMGGGYGVKSGTSMATPHVSGIAALVIASGITASSAVRDKLNNTAEDLGTPGWDTYFGNGLVDAAAAASLPSATGSIAGTVTNDIGDPIVNATVTANGYSIATADDGTYNLADLPVGNHTVTASAPGYVDASQTIGVLENQTTAGVDFGLAPQPDGNYMDMYVRSIHFTEKSAGRNIFLYVTVTISCDSDADGIAEESDFEVEGAKVSLFLDNTTIGESWTYEGYTDGTGQMNFILKKAPGGTYVASVTELTHSTYIWKDALDVENSSNLYTS